ncbi:MAG: hypothetical protein A3K59_09965 [Euryarchaeota archaeon RBG_19FT_COMBO_69_17]|nr:MAG: hypothetical protein A3K59_09965 [Euryarchaeota archaeon RBG_19FT_COMBO_69_17]
MAVEVRPLRLRDHSAVVALLDACGLHPRTRGRDSRSAFAGQLRSNRALYLGAFDGPRLVGMVLGTHDSRKGWINRLAVYPEYRRRGIGRRLVRACERALQGLGLGVFAALIEPRNDPSTAFFESLGYEPTQIRYVRRKLRQDL